MLFVDESSVTPAVSRLAETPQRSLSRFQGRSRLPPARLLASPSKTLKMDLISLGRGALLDIYICLFKAWRYT
jgi:hypothetical protein